MAEVESDPVDLTAGHGLPAELMGSPVVVAL